jgi:hypothetical protein
LREVHGTAHSPLEMNSTHRNPQGGTGIHLVGSSGGGMGGVSQIIFRGPGQETTDTNQRRAHGERRNGVGAR